MKIFLLFLFLIISPYSHAADKKVGDFANECSAIFLLMTMLPQTEEWKPFQDNMSNLSETMTLLAATIYVENNIDVTYRSIIRSRNSEADKVIAKYKRNKTAVLDQYARCDKFREDFAYAAMMNPNSDSDVANALRLPPSKVIMNEQKAALIKMVFDTSFATMEDAGIYSIVELFKDINP